MSQTRRRIARALNLAGLALAFATSAASGATLASSTFDVDDEGWIVTNGLSGGNPFAVLYESAGGNPGGHLRQIGVLALGFWTAPSSFLGDQSAAYGGALGFDLLIPPAQGGLNSGLDVVLVGNGTRLVLDLPNVQKDSAWQSFSVSFLPSADWRVDTLAGPAATGAQIHAVLSGLTAIRIRQEWVSGPDNSRLDNVVLSSPATPVPVPEPTALLLSAAALGAFLSARQWRRERGTLERALAP